MDVVKYDDANNNKKVKYLDEGVEFYGEMSDKPEIEQHLFKLQDAFYAAKTKTEKNKHWSDMFDACQRYSKSLILKKLRGKKFVEPDIVSDWATYAALVFMLQYINRPGFHCGASFAGLLEFKVRESMGKDTTEDFTLSLNMLVSEESGIELEDIQDKVNFESVFPTQSTPEQELFKTRRLKEVITDVLEDVDTGAKGHTKKQLLLRAWLSILLKRPRNKHSKRCFINNWCDYSTKKLIDAATLEIKNRLSL